MNENIEKADRIVGIKEDMWWASTSGYPSQNTYRRGAYCEWFAKNTQRDQWPNLNETIASQAERIVWLDAEERRKKHPDDGLPPGPWHRDACGVIHDAEGELLWPGRSRPIAEATIDHIVRCGSPAVRRLLAAFDVTEEQVHDCSVAVIRMANEAGTACATRTPWAGADILCWLTPRSKQ